MPVFRTVDTFWMPLHLTMHDCSAVSSCVVLSVVVLSPYRGSQSLHLTESHPYRSVLLSSAGMDGVLAVPWSLCFLHLIPLVHSS